MSDARTSILGQAPNFAFPYERPSEEDVASVALAIACVSTIEDLQILAYARYADAVHVNDLCERLGSSDVIRQVVSPLLAGLTSIDKSAMLEAVGSERPVGGRLIGRDADEGWALAILDLLAECGVDRVVALIGIEDPAYVLIRWIINNVWDTEAIQQIAEHWCKDHEALSTAAAGFLVLRSIDEAIIGQGQMVSLDNVPVLERVVISGRVISRLLSWRTHRRFNDEQRARLDDIYLRVKALVEQDLNSRPRLKSFTAAAGARDDLHVASFLVSLSVDVRTRRQAQLGAQETLQQIFARIAELDALRSEPYRYVAPWMINPLADIALNLPLSTPLFESLASNLRYDEFAYRFTYAHYLVDRPRAIVLCAIGAITATLCESADADLAEHVEMLAARLRALPPQQAVFSDVTMAEIHERYHAQIPVG